GGAGQGARGVRLAQEGPFATALDLAIDDDLRLEGLARELARALNDHRKTIGLAIADRIRVKLWTEGPLHRAAERHGPWIAGEVLAVDWQVAEGDGGDAVLEIEGSSVGVVVEPA